MDYPLDTRLQEEPYNTPGGQAEPREELQNEGIGFSCPLSLLPISLVYSFLLPLSLTFSSQEPHTLYPLYLTFSEPALWEILNLLPDSEGIY